MVLAALRAARSWTVSNTIGSGLVTSGAALTAVPSSNVSP